MLIEKNNIPIISGSPLAIRQLNKTVAINIIVITFESKMNASDPSQKGTTFRKRGDEEANQNRQLPNLNKSPKKHMEDPFSPTKTKYLPSRYGTAEVFNAMNTTKRTTMLHSLESDMAGLDHQISKLKPDVIPDRLREARSHNAPLSVFKPHEFKKKPMKKADMDFQMYQEVFVSPKEQVLHKLKEKEKVIDSLFNSVSTPNYDNPLGDPRADNKPKFSFNSTSTKSLSRPERQVNFKSKALQSVQSQNVLTHESVELPKSRLQETRSENKLIREKDLIKNTTISGGMLGADSNINDLEIANALEATAEPENHDDSKKLHNERVFFDQQIQVSWNYDIFNIFARCNLLRLRTSTHLRLLLQVLIISLITH